MKKMLIAILCSLLFIVGTLNVVASATTKIAYFKHFDTSENEVDKYINFEEQINETRFQTIGPRWWPLFKLKVENGSIIDKYSLLGTLAATAVSRIVFYSFPLMRPILLVISEQSKIDFTLEYKFNIPKENQSRYKYMTRFGEYVDGNFTDNSTTIYNTAHRVRVEGFYGAILLTKRCMVLSPTISLVGICDKAALIE